MRWTSLKRLHQCNQTSQLNNFNNYIDKINSQLREQKNKKIVTRNIYKEYELYLNSKRSTSSLVEKGLNQI